MSCRNAGLASCDKLLCLTAVNYPVCSVVACGSARGWLSSLGIASYPRRRLSSRICSSDYILFLYQAVSYSETSVSTYQTTRRNISECSHLVLVAVRPSNLTCYTIVRNWTKGRPVEGLASPAARLSVCLCRSSFDRQTDVFYHQDAAD